MITRPPTTDSICTDRNGIIENRYNVHAAITTPTGQLLYSVGDPHRTTLARSAAKPAQSLAILSTHADTRFDFSSADLALMTASHNAEQIHLDRARAMLSRIGCDESDLRCGGHASVNESLNREWIRAGFEPGPLCNNCSGKHAGMLAGAVALGAGTEGYHLPSHPMQVRVRETVEGLVGGTESGLRWGVDGCNLPAPAMPLGRLAGMYAWFAGCVDEDLGEGVGVGIAVGKEQGVGEEPGEGEGKGEGEPEPERKRAQNERAKLDTRTLNASRVFRAMTTHPHLVAGRDRFCTALMTTFKGALIGKVGADGCYGVGIRASEATRRLRGGDPGALGIAVKIEDGNRNILYAAVTEILEQLGVGTAEERSALGGFHRWEIRNTWGVVTGRVTHEFRVKGVQREQEQEQEQERSGDGVELNVVE